MDWPFVLDQLGIFFFAMSGSLLAARRGFDVVGSLLLGSLTGLGGGVMRDLILGVPPTAFARPAHLIPPVIAAIIVYFMMLRIERFSRTLLIFDAGGLALFCTTGTIAALDSGMNPLSAALLGAMTAVGGGLLRDVVANRVPQLFNRRDLYAVPALAGAGVTAVLWVSGALSPPSQLVVAAMVFGFRLFSLKFGWHVPHASRRTARTDGND